MWPLHQRTYRGADGNRSSMDEIARNGHDVSGEAVSPSP
jgi:hypothetical protein